jgi:hypothetical protein
MEDFKTVPPSDDKKNERNIIRLTLDLPVELHTKLKTYASRNRKTIIGVIKGLIKNLPDDK